MRRLGVLMSFILLVLALAICTTPSIGHASLPSVTISDVTVNSGSAVCRANDTGVVAISATVGAEFDTDSGPTQISNTCSACRPGTTGSGNNNCQTGNTSINSMRTVITQTKAYDQKVVNGYATDNNGSSNAPAFDVSSGSFGTLITGPEGKTTVTVYATASEREGVTNTTTVSYWTGGPTGQTACGGTQVGSDVVTTGSTSYNTYTSNRKSESGSYLVDLIGPTVTPGNPGFFNNPSEIQQTGSEIVHMQIKNGSAGTPWSVSVTATGPDSSEIKVTDNGTFGSSTDGIKEVTNPGPYTLPTTCDTTPGVYTLSATLKTQDLCGDAYDDINLTGDNFTVISALNLVAQTVVLSQLTSGEYGIDQCFVDSVKGKAKKLIVNNTPGSVHIGTIVTTLDSCGASGGGTISGVRLTMTLPPLDSITGSGFLFETTGNSPNAHIFVGDGSGGIDLHDGSPLTEVTDLVTQAVTGQTITIDLTNLGNIPTSSTIFARAHARFYATSEGGQPGPDTPFMFSSSVIADGLLSDPSEYYISANPTQLMNNLTGALLGGSESCDADGLFTP